MLGLSVKNEPKKGLTGKHLNLISFGFLIYMVLSCQSTALFILDPTECYKEQIKIMSINCVIIYLIHDIDMRS